jgi:Skp family chaperone for outer membrane proteins
MKSPLRKLLFTSTLVALLALPAAAQTKIGIMDLRKVFDGYYKTKAANAKLKDRQADMDKELTALTSQYQKAVDEYKKLLDDANNQTVSAEEREKRKKAAETRLRDLQDLERSITQFRVQANTTMEEEERRLRENILGEIKTVVSTRARAGGFSLVLDVAAESLSKTTVVMYSNGENDITDAVLTELNRAAPKEEKK